MDNNTAESFFSNEIPHGGDWYAGMAALVASVAAAIGSVIYAAKHIKTSECWGARCSQQVVIEQPVKEIIESNV